MKLLIAIRDAHDGKHLVPVETDATDIEGVRRVAAASFAPLSHNGAPPRAVLIGIPGGKQ